MRVVALLGQLVVVGIAVFAGSITAEGGWLAQSGVIALLLLALLCFLNGLLHGVDSASRRSFLLRRYI
ncbi:hypothetical protein [Dictyobacter arantiisoli]|uniref:Uncharacterized protein n=1 Tax=Dictyobacter arantiisoli TaxID=2014874 RepID=A0A5A5TAY5_9CHLR|nr:hypothetical protein [Dictyobacter arantiisoli]GCF08064.1 hypothetical protein KDI_16280 [Dictyobacter arantiisoli]